MMGPFLVLDEVLQGASPSTHYTSAEFNSIIGRMDKVVVMATADNSSGAGTAAFRLEHSADGRTWVTKASDIASGSTPAVGGAATVISGSDDGSVVNLPFVRIRITLTTSTYAHIKLYVSGRSY